MSPNGDLYNSGDFDVAKISAYISDSENNALSTLQQYAADMNSDAQVNQTDVDSLKNHISSSGTSVSWDVQYNCYTITFDTGDGGSTVSEQKVLEGELATEPTTAPTKADYDFGGWYNDDTEFDFDTPVTEDIDLKAKWLKSIENADIAPVEALTYNGAEQTQNVTVTLDGFDDVTFDVSGNKQTDVNTNGKYTLTVTGNGSFTGTKNLDWNISPATPAENPANKTTARVEAGRTLENASVKKGEILGVDGKPLNGTFAWVDGTKVIKVKGTEQMTFIHDNTNYKPITIDVAVDVYSSSNDIGGGISYKPTQKPTKTPVVGTIVSANSSIKVEAASEAINKAAAEAAKNDTDITLVTSTGTMVSGDDFTEPAIIGIAVDTSNVENVNNLTLAKFNTETGKLEIVGGWYDAETNTVRGYVDEAGDYFAVEKDGLITIILQIGSSYATLNNIKLALDTASVISQDRTMVPLRFIAEAFGADVSWIDATKTVVIEFDGQILTMQIGEELEGFDAAPIISNERTMVPIRYISEKFGAKVIWIPSTQTIYIAN